MNQNPATVPPSAPLSTEESSLCQVLEELIAFRTEGGDTGKPARAACLDEVEQILRRHGAARVIRLGNADGAVAALVGILNAGQGALRDINHGLLLCGHLDVVEGADSQFVPQQSGGRLYGRGAVDMKGSIACFLHLLPFLAQQPFPVLLAFTMDEESDMQGIRIVCDWLTRQRIRPTLTLLGEPTGGRLGIASCGIEGFRTEFYGRAAHSSRPAEGVNALTMGARLITRLDELAHEFHPRGIYLNAGTFTGGGNPATVPDRATLHWGFRSYSQEGEAELMQACRATVQRLENEDFPGGRIETQHECHFPTFHMTDHELVARLCRHLACEPAEIPYTTEAGYLQQAGLRVCLFGAGQPGEAHTAAESIALAELTHYTQSLRHLCRMLAAGAC